MIIKNFLKYNGLSLDFKLNFLERINEKVTRAK